MINKMKLFVTYSCLFILTSVTMMDCSDDSVSVIPVDSSDFKYPFKDGSYWSYTRTIYVSDIRPDSIRYYFNSYPLNFTGKTKILYDTVVNNVLTKCFVDDFVDPDNLNKSNRFYFINNDTALIIQSRRQNGPASGLLPMTIYGGDSSKSILKYPVVSGKQWIDFYSGSGVSITSKYINFENLIISNTTISCVKTSYTFSYINDPMYCYYSKSGMVKRSWVQNDIIFSTVTNPTGIGTIDIDDETIITEIFIPSN